MEGTYHKKLKHKPEIDSKSINPEMTDPHLFKNLFIAIVQLQINY